jgi:predicted DNA-binding transcriptional regulator AlpA
MDDRVLRISAVAAKVGVSTQTIARWSRQGHFPAPVKLSPPGERCGARGYLLSEVDEWLARQVASQRGAP